MGWFHLHCNSRSLVTGYSHWLCLLCGREPGTPAVRCPSPVCRAHYVKHFCTLFSLNPHRSSMKLMLFLFLPIPLPFFVFTMKPREVYITRPRQCGDYEVRAEGSGEGGLQELNPSHHSVPLPRRQRCFLSPALSCSSACPPVPK